MVNATTCPTADELRAMRAGHLAEEQSEAVIAHLHVCSVCQHDLETVDDGEDSLIAALRQPSEFAAYEAEAECQVALAKALATLANPGAQDVADPMSDLPRELGEYQIVRRLGQGGMGRVFLARHTKLGREVALKVLATHRLGDERSRRRFEAEMQAVGRLSHPQIVTAYDAREIAGTAVLVTEWIDGLDVGQLVRRLGPLPIADACEIVRQAAVALEYTHGQGFVHRDIKPSNLMLNRQGQVKLLDLGLARLQLDDTDRSEMTGTGQTMGTADYIAPEQVTDSRQVDGRADIYSLGCTLYKMLTGEAPFAGERQQTVFAKLTAHVSTAAPSLATARADAPMALVKLVDAMLAKDPATRPQTPREVAERIAKWTSGNDLSSLVARAELVAPDPLRRERSSAVADTVRPLPLPLLRRRVPVGLWIATTLVALGLGFVLGLIIRIKNPDGTQTVVQVPAGASVEVVEAQEERRNPSAAEGAVGGAGADARRRPNHESDQAMPWPPVDPSDGLDVRTSAANSQQPTAERSLDDRQIAGFDARRRLQRIAFGIVEVTKPDRNAGVVRVPMAEGVLPDVRQRSARLRATSDAIVSWPEIRGHLEVTSTQGWPGYSPSLILNFDDTLGKRMQRLTNEYRGQLLAFVVNGHVIALPRIDSTLSQQVIFDGPFREEDLTYLDHALGEMNTDALPFGEELPGGDKLTQTAQPADKLTSPTDTDQRSQTNPDHAVLSMDELLEQITPAAFGIVDLQADESTGLALRLADGVLPQMVVDSGDRMAAIRVSPDAVIGWSEIKGQLSASTSQANETGERRLELLFEEGLASRMERLTEKYQGQYLAFIVNGRIIAAPRIVSTISRHAVLQGNFQHPDIDLLMQALNGLMIDPSTSISRPRKTVADAREEGLVLLHRQLAASRNLQSLAQAILSYVHVNGHFPASAISDGKNPPHSWRVAILPYLGEQELYERYRFDEPWDSEANQLLLRLMPSAFRSPLAPDEPGEGDRAGETHYLGFVGPESVFDNERKITMADIGDGTSSTLLIVETANAVPWTKPADIPFASREDAQQAVAFELNRSIPTHRLHLRQPLRFITVDGRALNLNANDPQLYLKLGQLITRDGGELIPRDWLTPIMTESSLHKR